MPGYLIDLIAIKEQPRYNLLSASGLVLSYLILSSLNLKKTLGNGAFSSAAADLWKNLPLHSRLEDNFERLDLYLKRIFLDWLLICNVLTYYVSNIFSVFVFI